MARTAANKTEWLKSLVQQFELGDLFGLLGFSKTALQQGSEPQPMDSDLTDRKLSDRQQVDRRVIAEPPRNCPHAKYSAWFGWRVNGPLNFPMRISVPSSMEWIGHSINRSASGDSRGGSMHGSVRANRRQRNATAHVEYGPLELRQVLNGIPIANPDPHFVTPLNTQLVVPIATGVLANDFDAEGSTLTATKLTNPASGVVTFNGDGSFTYTPNTNFVGVDAFTYQISDATINSPATTVFIAVGQTFSYKLNADERGSNNLLHTGSLPVAIGISGTDQLVHLADTVTPYAHVPLETIYNGPPAGSSLTFLTAELTFNGTVTSTVSYNTGLSALASGTALRFSLRANNTHVLATGMYNWSIKLTATFSNSTTSNALFSGAQAVVNRNSSDFGTGWWLSDYDRLFPQTSGAVGALLVDSDGSSRWFSWNAGTSTYNLAEGVWEC